MKQLRVNEERFNEIKARINEGMSFEPLKKKLHTANMTIKRIRNSHSYADYLQKYRQYKSPQEEQYLESVANKLTVPDSVRAKLPGEPPIQMTEEKFNYIKELLYRGETHQDITHMAYSAYDTIRKVERAHDFAEYKANLRKIPDDEQEKEYAVTNNLANTIGEEPVADLPPEPLETIPLPGTTLDVGDIEQIKRSLDEAILTVIVRAVAANEHPLKAKIKELQIENEALKIEIAQLKGATITEKIKLAVKTWEEKSE